MASFFETRCSMACVIFFELMSCRCRIQETNSSWDVMMSWWPFSVSIESIVYLARAHVCLVKQPNIRLTKYALKLSRKDLRVLAGLLTGHADLNRHLTLMQVRNDEICPLCQEAEATTLHLLGKCCALINQRLVILGSHYLEYEDLALLHWRPLLRLAKASKRFWISGLHTGPIM